MRDFAASRMQGVAGSGTVRMTDLAARLRAEGREVIGLSAGEPDFDTPPHIREAAAKALEAGYTKYTSSHGIPALREAVAEKSRRENRIPCEARHVLVTPAKQAIFEAIFACAGPGDEVVVTDPAWVSYEPIIAMAGAKLVPVPVVAEHGFRMRPGDVAEALTPRTKLLVVNSPNNPTGSVSTDADLKGIADLARDHDLWVLSDEIYEHLVYDGHHLSLASLPGMFERTVTVNGFSKSYAMTGWRLGWAVAPEPALREMSKVQQHTITHPTAFAMLGGLEALRGDQSFIGAMRETFRRRRDLVVEALNRVPGLTCPVPAGAFYVFPRFRHAMGSEALAERLLLEGGVALTPGRAFGPRGEGHLRISYATSDDNLRKALARIAEVCGKLA